MSVKSSVDWAFLGGRTAHPGGQIGKDNEEKLRKNERKLETLCHLTMARVMLCGW